MKTCFKCNQTKPLSEFYKHPQMGDGHLNKCKECAKSDSKLRIDSVRKDPEWVKRERARCRKKSRKARAEGKLKPVNADKKKETIKRYREKYPEKYKAQLLSQHLKPEPCEVCGDPKTERHHDDYSKPRDVRWLCKKHHMEFHVRQREQELIK